MSKKFLITGGAGFIGSAVIRHILSKTNHSVVNIDKLTYAGNLNSLASINGNKNYFFEKIDMCDSLNIRETFKEHQPDIIMHLAAESHVDRSIDSSLDFMKTNIMGTHVLLEESKKYWLSLKDNNQRFFRFHHVSTDEVYGDLGTTEGFFTEDSPYAPSSPYSASKASSDHLVRAWWRTFGLPTIITNCSNNYGPYQFPEKLIPLMIQKALEGKNLPIYGDGKQVRDWLFVEDHAAALVYVALNGQIGETYNIGGNNELQNLSVVKILCRILDELIPCEIDGIKKYEDLIIHVQDRAGHDERYAIDSSKIYSELGWKPNETFQSGIRKTVEWYLENQDWCNSVKDGSYSGERLGVLDL